MERWQDIVSKSISDDATLSKFLKIDKSQIKKVIDKYPIRINSYYIGLIKKKGDAIWKQCVPDTSEITNGIGRRDPLLEEKYTPIQGLVHRYKDRILLLVSNKCATYCRFCTRKRKVGLEEKVLKREDFKRAFQYIEKHKFIRDVIISGGDPLLLSDERIEYYLKRLRKIKHIQIIRIDSRTPCVLPQRITPKLCNMLKKYSPLYFNTHFNHYQEITPSSQRACRMLAEKGIVMGNQAVLLKNINDHPKILKRLFEGLLIMKVRPYYIYLPDAVKGTYHFRVSIKRAVSIMKELIGHTSGLAIPHLIIDLKRGGGKTPLLPKYIVKHTGKRYVFKNFEGKQFYYADVG